MAQGLKNNTVALRQAQQRSQLVFGSIGGKLEVQPDALNSNRYIFDNPQRASKVYVTLGLNGAMLDFDANGCGDGAQCHSSASHQRLKQQIARAHA